MKRFPLLPLFALVFAVAYACTDSTAPATSHRLTSPKDPTALLRGDPPPPPVDAAINITISSTPFTGAFNGAYFANGSSLESTVAAQNVGDESLTFQGTAWLRLDNVQPPELGTSTSANARFQRTDLKLFGMGTLKIADSDGIIHTVTNDQVTSFQANPSCGAGEACAVITFDASVDGESGHHGTAEAFNKAFCNLDGIYFCSSEID
jgi:hypothetical protein